MIDPKPEEKHNLRYFRTVSYYVANAFELGWQPATERLTSHPLFFPSSAAVNNLRPRIQTYIFSSLAAERIYK